MAGVAGAAFRREPGPATVVIGDEILLRKARVRRIWQHVIILATAYASLFLAITGAILTLAVMLNDPWRKELGLVDPGLRALSQLLILSLTPVLFVAAARSPRARWNALEVERDSLSLSTSVNAAKAPHPSPRRRLRMSHVLSAGLLLLAAWGLGDGLRRNGLPQWAKAPEEDGRSLNLSVHADAWRNSDGARLAPARR
jgi:hypothetical protein